MFCPRCMSEDLVLAGSDRGRQRWQCKNCSLKTVNPVVPTDEELDFVKKEKQIVRLQDNLTKNNRSKKLQYKLIEVLEQYNETLIATLEKFGLSKQTKAKNIEICDDVGIVQLSDLHFNEIIENPDNQYDFNIASRRLQKFAAEIKKYMPKNVKKIVLAMTGDFLNSNRRVEELLNMSTNRTKAVFVAVDILKSFILDLNDSYDISVTCTYGNESRIEKDWGWTELVASDNFDLFIFNILKTLFKGSESVHFIDNAGVEVVMNINGANILFAHGNFFKPDMNQKQLQSIIGKYSQRGIILSYIIVGHYHSSFISDLFARSSALCGGNAYSDIGLQLYSRAAQNMFIVSKNKQITGIKIDLQDCSGYKGYDFAEPEGLRGEKKSKNKLYKISNLG
ncbi:MAG: hypothetical protein M0R51_15755 [Clostridia bacterium]|nr:hypothetical protein [Clostridia bacterium]